ncbi:hypothetical protein WJX72_004508 [[Myrmecia] bisecta]|uniref:Cyclin n=1 Tax=[Myrmecia] bisecta TaxID=41462 RepID=A0AAW1PSW4_9CHLO
MAPLVVGLTHPEDSYSTPKKCSLPPAKDSRLDEQARYHHEIPDTDSETSTTEDVCCDSTRRSQYCLLLNHSAGDDGPEVFGRLARVLEAAVVRNDQSVSTSGLQPECLTSFHGLRPPPISIEAYIQRIGKYAKCSPVCFAMAYTYMERLARTNSAYQLMSLNVHRMVVTSVLLAAKLTDDNYFNNAYYAKIGGISTAEINKLELELLKLLDYRLCVSEKQVQQVLRLLEAPVGSRRSKKRVSEDSSDLPQPPHKQEAWRHADSTSGESETTSAVVVVSAVQESDDPLESDSDCSTADATTVAEAALDSPTAARSVDQASKCADKARRSIDDAVSVASAGSWQHAADVELSGGGNVEDESVIVEGLASFGSRLAIMASA